MRLAVFASGSGSNLQAILDSGAFNVVLCLSNTDRAGALARAQTHGVESVVLNPDGFAEESAYTAALLGLLRKHAVDTIALAGYLRKIPAPVVAAYRHRIVNIHPALLPAFGGKGLYGRRVHEAVLRAGMRQSGATVHYVDEEYDTGGIILQEAVPVYPEDTPETLARRVLELEHRLYPKALRLVAGRAQTTPLIDGNP